MPRSKLAICILVIISLVSLGFNGYFVNQKVKSNHQSKINLGKRIIQSYYDANMFAGIIRGATDDILEDRTLGQRLSYKYQIGLASQYAQSIPSLIVHAEQISGETFEEMKYTPQFLFTEINNALGIIASHQEKLTEDEMKYLEISHRLFEQVDHLLKSYVIPSASDEHALDMINGGDWIRIAEQINDIFVASPDIEYLFTYRSIADGW